MSTAEDVFYLYERNSLIYKNKSNDDENYKQVILPYTIGDQDTPCKLKIKCYIRPGEECPICIDKIQTKSSAFLTNCGHSFHKECLFNSIKSKWSTSGYTSVARCPMCRCSLGHPDFIQRYKASYFTEPYRDDNEIDKLEDFWLSKDYKLPFYCSNSYDHYLGCERTCFSCKEYREKGSYIYEIN
jgi:hypothetical protein